MIKRIKRAIQRFIIATVADDIQNNGKVGQWIHSEAISRSHTNEERRQLNALNNWKD